MSGVSKCIECGSMISNRFPIHVCKSVTVFDGDTQSKVKRVTIDERDAEVERLSKLYQHVSVDVDGDIIFHKEE